MMTKQETLESLNRIKQTIQHVKDNTDSKEVHERLETARINIDDTRDVVNGLDKKLQNNNKK